MYVADPRVADWPLMASPGPVVTIFLLYLATVRQGPRLIEGQKAVEISSLVVVYNAVLVIMSAYMCYEVRKDTDLHFENTYYRYYIKES